MLLPRSRFCAVVLLVILGNYALQLPYYLHQYYVPAHVAPNLAGTALLGVTLLWFLAGLSGLWHRSTAGYRLFLAFLMVECLFYLQTQLAQFFSGHGLLLYVAHPSDPLLFVVFGMGYLNGLVAGWASYYLLRHRAAFLAPAPS
jgi:hypothetical protein